MHKSQTLKYFNNNLTNNINRNNYKIKVISNKIHNQINIHNFKILIKY